MLQWGATLREAAEALPGDDQTPDPRVQSTRAISIEAPPERVWPWLAQMGIGRAGFYTHDWLERPQFRARYVDGKHSATRIHPELQDLKPRDRIYVGGGAYAPVTEVKPFRHLVSFETFVLRPLPGNRTRLIARTRGMGYVQPAVHAIAPDASTAAPADRLRRPPPPRRGSARPGIRLLHRRSAAPLHGHRDAQGHQDASGGSVLPWERPHRQRTARRLPPWSPWRPDGDPPAEESPPEPTPARRAGIAAIKTVHTLTWFSIESCVLYVLYAGFARRSDRRTAIAASAVAGETLRRQRVPLPADPGGPAARRPARRVTDIWLPRWFAHNLPGIHTPLLALAIYLHAHNLRALRRPTASARPGREAT